MSLYRIELIDLIIICLYGLFIIGAGIRLMKQYETAEDYLPQIQNFTSLFRYPQRVLSYAVSPMVALFLFGIFWKLANAKCAFYAILLGTSSGAILFVINEILKWTHLHFLYVTPLLLGISSMVLVLVSLKTTPPPLSKVQNLSWSRTFFKGESIQLQPVPFFKTGKKGAGNNKTHTLSEPGFTGLKDDQDE